MRKRLPRRSSRVKAVDFHPTNPWIIAGLYTGSVIIWNYETEALVKTFEVTEVPVRSVAFIARKNWFVCGSDDFHLRVYNYNTQERIAAFEAHPDYIRCLAVHPTQSLVLTGSDDMTIKLWDWDKSWKCVQVGGARSFCLETDCGNKADRVLAGPGANYADLRRAHALHYEDCHQPERQQPVRVGLSR